MVFVAILYSQRELTEVIKLDENISLIPLGYRGLIEDPAGIFINVGFKFAYVEEIKDFKKNIANTQVKKFLEFFSFLTDDVFPIKEFEKLEKKYEFFDNFKIVENFLEKNKTKKIRETETSLKINKNFSIYYSPSSGKFKREMDLSFAWSTFLEKKEKYRNQVSLYCSFFSGPRMISFQVFDNDTYRIFSYIAIIEGILFNGVQNNTCKVNCNECNKEISHNINSTKDIWEQKLSKKLFFKDNQKYIDLIINCHKNIRHPFAHSGKLIQKNIIDNFLSYGSYSRSIPIDKCFKLIKTDELAIENIILVIQRITRRLLLLEFYPEPNSGEIWPEMAEITEFRI